MGSLALPFSRFCPMGPQEQTGQQTVGCCPT